MAKPLQTASISAPGFFGLNTQDSSVDLESGFAVVANNAVIDKFGRIGARKGWSPVSNSPTALAGQPIEAIGELAALSGSYYTIVAGNNKLFKLDGGVLTELNYVGGGTAPTITANKWEFAFLEGVLWAFQAGHTPLYFNPATSTTGYYKITDSPEYGTAHYEGNTVLAAYGRLWTADVNGNNYTLYWSDILKGADWTSAGAGSNELTSVFTNGMDQIVAIEAIAGLLVVLCRRSVIIFEGAAVDPNTNIKLREVIKNVGCISRDTVQNIGNDILFLSDQGLMSVQRLQESDVALPMRDLSRNVRDDIIEFSQSQLPNTYVSGYFPIDALYVLSNPVLNKCYVFDTRSALQDGSARVTTWTGLAPYAMFMDSNYKFLLGMTGYVGSYTGYTDNNASYRMEYYTNYQKMDSDAVLKILKNIGMTVVGGSNQGLIIKWGFDFQADYRNISNILSSQGALAYYNVNEYGSNSSPLSEYNSGASIESFRVPASGSGAILQVGVESDINGAALSIQALRLYLKTGRIV